MEYVFDQQAVTLMDRVQAVKWRDVSVTQLISYYKCVATVEKKCKWFHTSCQAKNLMRRIKDEIDRKLAIYRKFRCAA